MTARRQRRIQPLRKASHRKHLPRLLGTVLTLCLVGGAVASVYHMLSQPGYLPLRVVEVKGDFRHLETGHLERSVIDAIDASDGSCDAAVEASVRADVAQLLERFPIYEGA